MQKFLFKEYFKDKMPMCKNALCFIISDMYIFNTDIFQILCVFSLILLIKYLQG